MEWKRSDLIQAPAERVWDLTIDIERWPEILPTVTKVTRLDSGPFGPGSRALIEQPGLKAEWRVRTIEPYRSFVWETHVRGRRLVAEHVIDTAGDGSARNTLKLELTGARAVLLGALLGPLMRLTLAREARAFRRRAEAESTLTPAT